MLIFSHLTKNVQLHRRVSRKVCRQRARIRGAEDRLGTGRAATIEVACDCLVRVHAEETVVAQAVEALDNFGRVAEEARRISNGPHPGRFGSKEAIELVWIHQQTVVFIYSLWTVAWVEAALVQELTVKP
jgi:hypothetical protein